MTRCQILFKKSLNLRYYQFRTINNSIKQTPAEYCLELVRKHDYENFLCTLLLPSNLRSSAFAIRAFNSEIALIEDQIQDNKIGLIRIKFWEETLNNIYNNNPPKNPTSQELHRILQNKKLSKKYFKRLIDARCNILNTSTFINLESMEKYAEYTVSSIYYLLLEAQETKDINTDHFASHLGKSYGIVTLIRSVPHNAQNRKIMLPQDLLMKYNISSESIIQRKYNKNLQEVIFEIASKAKQHLDKALSLKDKIKKDSNLIFLSSFIIENYLQKLQETNFDIYNSKLQQKNNLLPLKLYWKKLFI